MPSLPTNSAWVAAWQALTVSGVKNLKTPPLSLDTAKVPAMWPELPQTSIGGLQVSCTNENKARQMVFHLAIEPIGQNTQAGNYENALKYMDALETAVDGLRGETVNFLDYTLAMVADIYVGKETFWGFRVEATGRSVRA